MFTKFEIMSKSAKVYFFFDKVKFNLRNRGEIKKTVERIFKMEGRKLERINYIFCTDKRLLEINRQFLKHDYYTDIITFDLSEPGSPTNAEVYISLDRVRENAQKMNVSITNELRRVIFHGALHLCGYGDKTKAERERMRGREDFYLCGS